MQQTIKNRIVHRFYAICKPFDYDHFMNTYSAMGMIAAAWLFPTFISFVPIFLGWYATDKHLEVRRHNFSLFSGIQTKYFAVCTILFLFVPGATGHRGP